MKQKDYDGVKDMLERIRLAAKHEDNALKAKKNTAAKGYRTELNLWIDALAMMLADGMARRKPGEFVPAVAAHHVVKLVAMVDAEYFRDLGGATRERCLDEIEKILAETA